MIDLSLKEYSHLLKLLYDGALEPSPWQSFLQHLNEVLGLQGCYLFLRYPREGDNGLMFSSRRDQEYTPDNPHSIYAVQQLYTSDPLVILPINEVVTLDDLIEERELLESRFYQVCMEPFHIRYTAGIDLEFENGQRFSFRLSRSPSQGDFNRDEREFIKMLSEHIHRAVIAGEKLVRFDNERQLWANTLARTSVGMIMLDQSGEIVKANAVADRYLKSKDGLRQVGSGIGIDNVELNRKFKGQLKEALAAKKSGERIPIVAFPVPRPSGEPDYELVLKPVPIDPLIDSRGSPHFSLLIYSPERAEDIDQQTLMRLYNLTATEASVAIALGAGQTVDGLAEELGMKVNTARAHIRSIFSKTGVTQQTQLVRLVLKSLAAIP